MTNFIQLPTDARKALCDAYQAALVDALMGTVNKDYAEGGRLVLEALVPAGDLYTYDTFNTEAKTNGRWHFVGWGHLGTFNPEYATFKLKGKWLLETNTLTNEQYRYSVEDLLPYMQTGK